jgi:uncharacterized BrkB/YihY/UPF0761 family membrane protein
MTSQGSRALAQVRPYLFVLLVVGLLLAAFLSAMQAVTLMWISALSGSQSELASLRARFWPWAVVTVLLLSAGLWLAVRTIRKSNRQDQLALTKNAVRE